MVTVDALRSLLHPSNNLIGLHDSGDYVEIDPLNKKLDPFMDQCLKAYQFYNHPDVIRLIAIILHSVKNPDYSSLFYPLS